MIINESILNESVSRNAVGQKLEKEFPKLTKKYFGKEIKVVFSDVFKDDSFGGCVGHLYPAEYNEETEKYDSKAVELFQDIGSWSIEYWRTGGYWRSGDHYPKNFSDFMDDLEKIGVRRLSYGSNFVHHRLYVYYMEPGTDKFRYADVNDD